MKEFIDATIFMGMHSRDEQQRIACKNFFIQRLKKTVFMSLESVGKCDDMVWQFDRKTQDDYYPFMDRLHTIMKIRRIPYEKKDLSVHPKKSFPAKLPLMKKLTIAQAIAQGAILYTLDKQLLYLNIPMVRTPDMEKNELHFEKEMEKWYKLSLKLKVRKR